MSTTATNIAITSAANAQAAAANVAAQEAKRKACMAYVRGYEHDRATVEEMREYAGCIDRLHPESMLTEGQLVAAKCAVLFVFAWIVVGVIWERRNKSLSEGWFGAVVGGSVIGMCFAVAALLFLAGVYFGVKLLLA